MPNLSLLPLQKVLVDNTTTATTTSGVSGVIALPFASSYRFVTEVHTVSGTSPTLDVMIATSEDGGTNFNQFIHFAQSTTSGVGSAIVICPNKAATQAAVSHASTLDGTANIASGATVVATDGPFDPANLKVRWVLSGTTPSFAFAVKCIMTPAGFSDD